MRRLQFLSMPLATTVLVAAPVFWAFPVELAFWRSIAIVSGWAGCGLLLASLLFMLREARLAEWLGGLERMYLWHHRLGIFAYLILLIHPLALAADAWEEAPALAWSALAPWHAAWPVWMGWMSLLCMMLGLGVSLSPRLPYAAWRYLHNLLAVAVVLAFFHLFLLGLDYLLLWAPILAIAFMLWRVFRADFGLAAKPYLVAGVAHPAEAMVEISLRPLAQPLLARPGQFVLVAFLNGPHFRGCGEYHPFTISAIAPNGEISLGIKALGDCTRHLQSVESGVAVRVQGPFGDFLANHGAGPTIWIAGGIGITPFLAVLRNGPLSHPVRLIYLHRNDDDAAYRDELRALAVRQPALSVLEVPSGNALPDLAKILPSQEELSGKACFLCGPPGLIAAAVRLLEERAVAPQNIHFERFDFR